MDAVIGLLNDWQPPPVGAAAKARLIAAALRAAGVRRPPPAAEGRDPPARPQAHHRARPRGRPPPLRRRQRVLLALPRRVDDLLLRLLLPRPEAEGTFSGDGRRPSRRRRRRSSTWSAPSSRCSRASGCSTSAAAGAASSCTPRERYGVEAVGITLSENQAELARKRVADAGLADQVEIRVQDYRELAGENFDAVASIGMVEHVGEAQIDRYAEQLASMLRPGGRLLNHGISRLKHGSVEGGPFSERYVFPDGETLHVSRVILALERAGLHRPARRGVRRRLRRDAAALDREPRREPRAGRADRRPGAAARLAPLPAGGPERLRDRLHLGLPGALPAGPDVADRADRARAGGRRRSGFRSARLLPSRPLGR